MKALAVGALVAVGVQVVVTAVSMVLCGWDAYMPRTGVDLGDDDCDPHGIPRPVLS